MSSLSDYRRPRSPYKQLEFRSTSQSCDKKPDQGWFRGKSDRHETTINILPEDVLLEIFDNCERDELKYDTNNPYCHYRRHGPWHTLVHVCQRWRQTIFESPRHLSLKLRCTNGTPVRKNLYHFPTLPIVIRYDQFFTPGDEDNLSAALEHPDRIFHIHVTTSSNSLLRKIAAEMQDSFPVLTGLLLMSVDRHYWDIPSLPDGFLSGSAPCLQEITLVRVPFQALPTLLLSANDLVVLLLDRIPWIGYVQVSPEAMVLCLATSTRLKTLQINFRSPPPNPGRICPPPEVRAILPALTSFEYGGFLEYLGDLVSRIDCPQLKKITIRIIYSSGLEFRAAQLAEFVNRSDNLQPILFRRMNIDCREGIYFGAHNTYSFPASVCIICEVRSWQFPGITDLLIQLSAILTFVVHLQINAGTPPEKYGVQVGLADADWLPLLHQFTAVRTLYISEEISGDISHALDVVAREKTTDVLPALSLLCLENQPPSSVERFVAVRRDSGRPVTVLGKTEFDTRVSLALANERTPRAGT